MNNVFPNDNEEVARRQLSGPPRTWVFSCPFFLGSQGNPDAVAKDFLRPFAGGNDIPAQVLMHYIRYKDGDQAANLAWSLALLVDYHEVPSQIVNLTMVETRVRLMSLMLGIVASQPMTKDEGVPTTMVANAAGLAFSLSLAETSEEFVMRQHRVSSAGLLIVTHIDRYGYEHYADLDPRVEHIKICDLPTKQEAFDAYQNYMRSFNDSL